MKISDNVRMVPVPEDQPMRPTSTNIYIIGQRGGQTLTIDSGEAIDKFRWMLRGYLAAIDHSEIGVAAITHHHFDHSGNLKHVNEHLKADVAVPENGVRLLRGRLPKEGVKTYVDGDTIDLDGGIRVQVMTSPGHSVDSLCYYIEEEGILFTGDTILGNTTTVVGDVNSYMASLPAAAGAAQREGALPGSWTADHRYRGRQGARPARNVRRPSADARGPDPGTAARR